MKVPRNTRETPNSLQLRSIIMEATMGWYSSKLQLYDVRMVPNLFLRAYRVIPLWSQLSEPKRNKCCGLRRKHALRQGPSGIAEDLSGKLKGHLSLPLLSWKRMDDVQLTLIDCAKMGKGSCSCSLPCMGAVLYLSLTCFLDSIWTSWWMMETQQQSRETCYIRPARKPSILVTPLR